MRASARTTFDRLAGTPGISRPGQHMAYSAVIRTKSDRSADPFQASKPHVRQRPRHSGYLRPLAWDPSEWPPSRLSMGTRAHRGQPLHHQSLGRQPVHAALVSWRWALPTHHSRACSRGVPSDDSPQIDSAEALLKPARVGPQRIRHFVARRLKRPEPQAHRSSGNNVVCSDVVITTSPASPQGDDQGPSTSRRSAPD